MKLRLFKTIALLVLVVLAGCQSAQRPDRAEPRHYVRYPVTAADELAIQRGVISELKHPDGSATFGDARASISTAGIVMVCGFVKATFGGHENPRKIIYQGLLKASPLGRRLFLVTGFGGRRSQDAAIVSLCREHGIVLG